MTFLHKLAKRLALIPPVLVCTLSLLASCSEGTPHDYLGPDPTKPNPSGAYIGLSIIPHDPQLVQGDSVRLAARGWLASGLSEAASVTWTAAGGTVSGEGWFRSTSVGSFRVRAVLTANAALSDSVLITVIPSGGIARLDITPAAVPLAAGTRQQFTAVALMGDGSRTFPTVTWTATGGTISPSGLFTAAGTPGGYTVTATMGDGALLGRTAGIVDPPVLTGLAIDPAALMLESGATRQFMPYASWSDGSNSVPPLTWTATGGSLTSSVVYTAGNTPGSYRVIASSALGKADTANVTILPRIVAIRLAPLTALLAFEATQVVTAYALRNDGIEGPVGVVWSAEGGSISLDGMYTAGNIPGTYPVVGRLTALDGSILSDTANFEVGADDATIVQIFVRPDTSVVVGSRVQFSASGALSGGGSAVPAVTWSATGGSIDSKGLYTAGSVPGNYKVTGKRRNNNKADTASVIVTPAPILTISAFTISPETDIIGAGQSRQFSTALSWSDGQVHPADVSWVSAGGTITQNGLYTAGTLAGSFLVIATCGCGAADTASVTIPAGAAPPVTLSQLVLSPATVQLDPGAAQIFTVAGVWSDGATSQPAVTFVASGGSITSAGVYTAANAAGTYRVIATQTGGGLADTSIVTIQAGAATLTQLVLNPSAVSLAPAGTQQFTVSGSWSDGSSVAPAVTWTVGGGSITSAGLYTAGTVAGTFRVIATQTGGTKADTSAVTIAVPPPPVPGPTIVAELPRTFLNTTYSAPTGRTINVPAGGDLQAALNNSICGDAILLAPGASYSGSFALPPRNCATNMIHIRTAGTLPPEGVRVTPAVAAGFAKIVGNTGDAPIWARNGARGFRLIGLEVTALASLPEIIGLVYIGGDGREAWDGVTVSALPGETILDRMYIHGQPHQKSRRCVAVNGVALAVINSYLSMCQSQDTDAQAVWSSYGPGPYKIANNYLEGSGENIMFGGSDAPSAAMIPQDIEIRGNLLSKPDAWRTSGEWLIKNLFELKDAKRVLIEGNIFENSWMAAHTGFAIGFLSANQSGSAPWSQVADVTFRKNYVRHSGAGINIAGTGAPNSTLAARIGLTDNVFEDIGRRDLLSDGRMVQIIGGVTDVMINHNTFLHTPGGFANSAIYLANGSAPRATITNNIFTPGDYGIAGDAIGQGTVALAYYMPDGVFLGNVFAGPVDWSRPPNNFFVSSVTALGFDSQLRLGAGSGLKARATDGKDPGADIDALLTATANVVP